MADQQPNTIAIPGIQDIIRIPALEDVKIKRERIQRMRASNSALPQALNWLPAAINFLDNAEDQLIVALTTLQIIAKYGPRVAALGIERLAPVIGWALIADDILNATNSILELLTGGSVGKINYLKVMRSLLLGRAARIARAKQFLRGGVAWWGYAVQAGQVLYTYTGYGLQLGGIFGAMSDTAWGAIKALGGQPLTIIGPPPDDLAVRSAQALMQVNQLPFIMPGLTPDEVFTTIAGLWAAAVNLGGDGNVNVTDDRLADAATTPMPVWAPWSPSSLEALAQENIPVDETMVNALPFYQRGATFGDAFRVGGGAGGYWDVQAAPVLQGAPGAQLANGMLQDLANLTWGAYFGPGGVEKPLTPYEKMQGIAVESNVWPPWAAGVPSQCGSSIFWPDPPPPLTQHDCAHLWYMETYKCPPEQPDCTIFPDGTFVCRPHKGPPCVESFALIEPFALPPAYPPDPSWDQKRTLAHWLWIALRLYCGDSLQLPIYADNTTVKPTAIVGWTPNTKRHGQASAFHAAILVWGNAWKKPRQSSGEHFIWPAINICAKGPDGLPQLFGPYQPNPRPEINIHDTTSAGPPPGILYAPAIRPSQKP